MSRIYTQDEINAVDKAEREYAPLGLRFGNDANGKNNLDMLLKYFEEWNSTFPINAATIKQAIDELTEKNLLKWISPAQLAFEAAARGLSAQQLATLNSGLSAYSLIADQSDEGYSNKAAMLGYLQGRSIDHATIFQGANYLQAKGTKLHFKPMPSQNQPTRGHNAHSPADMHFMPKSEVNRPFSGGRPNHANNPNFNGAKERQERLEQQRRIGQPDPTFESHNATERYWQHEIDKLIATGTTHSERGRIAQVAQQSPGSARQRHAAVKAEADRLRREKELAR